MKLQNMQTGPPLHFPDGAIRKYVVTDTEPDLSVRKSLWKQGVQIVVPPNQDFPQKGISFEEWEKHGDEQIKRAEQGGTSDS